MVIEARLEKNMSTHAVYRLCIWLPVLVPASVIGVALALDVPLADGIVLEILLYSLVYGGLPYAALGSWATWWVGGRSEREIRRLMFVAPLLMAVVFGLTALVIGAAVGTVGPVATFAVVGGLVILPLGYAYVGVTVLLMRGLRPLLRASA
jgi:hypothetical protein